MSQRLDTMAAFAEAAGLSRPTVSRYFNDPQSVRSSTRARIEAALEQYDYRPNLLASSLMRSKSRILGVLVPHLGDPFYTDLVRHVELGALQRGYFTIALSSYGDATRERQAIDGLLSMNVAAVAATPLGFASDLAAYERLCRQVPVVFLDSRVPVGEALFATDNAKGIELVVDYLLRTGEPPAYFDMPHVNTNALQRREAYFRRMAQAGMEPRLLVDGRGVQTWDFERFGRERARALIHGGRLREGVVLCANDRIAFGVLAAAFEAGLPVGRGERLRVAGHDNQPLSEFACPSLTTAAQQLAAIARTGVLRLLARVGGEVRGAPEDHFLEPTLVLRESA